MNFIVKSIYRTKLLSNYNFLQQGKFINIIYSNNMCLSEWVIEKNLGCLLYAIF